MATRLYLPIGTAADVSPSFSGSWGQSSQGTRRKFSYIKGSSVIAIGLQVGPWTTNSNCLDRQYVSKKMPAGISFSTASSTFQAQLMSREYANTDNVRFFYLRVFIWDAFGTTLRATLNNPINTTNAEFINNATCRNTSLATTLVTADYTTSEGDRLVCEFGWGDSSGNTPEAGSKYGENAADLPVNETQTTNGAPWLESSTNLNFYDYIIKLVAGIYTSSGVAVTLKVVRAISLASGSYSSIGNNILLKWNRVIKVDQGVYSYTGNNVVISKSVSININTGNYNSSGNVVTIKYIRVLFINSGIYSSIGNNVILSRVRKLICESSIYRSTGNQVRFSGNPPFDRVPLSNTDLRIICQFMSTYFQQYYPEVAEFVNDMYVTGCRPNELMQQGRWVQSIIDIGSWTLTPEKNNSAREIKKTILSQSLTTAIIGNIPPYNNLSLRQLLYSVKTFNPVGVVLTSDKFMTIYLMRYNKVRTLLDNGMSQANISSYFGWVAPTIIATYTTRNLYSFIDNTPQEQFYITNDDNIVLIDSNGDFIIQG